MIQKIVVSLQPFSDRWKFSRIAAAKIASLAQLARARDL